MTETKRSQGSGSTPPPAHRVVAIVVPRMSPLETAVASEVFGIDRQVPDAPWYRLRLCTPVPGPVRLESGLPLQINHARGARAGADTALIPGWGDHDEPVSPE